MALIKTIKGLAPKWGRDCYFSENATIVGEVTMGDECSIWFNAVVRGDVAPITIGDRTIIGAGSVVTKDIPSDVFAAGNPCRVSHSARAD